MIELFLRHFMRLSFFTTGGIAWSSYLSLALTKHIYHTFPFDRSTIKSETLIFRNSKGKQKHLDNRIEVNLYLLMFSSFHFCHSDVVQLRSEENMFETNMYHPVH